MSAETKIPEIAVIGLNHKTAPVDVRERLSLPDEAVRDLLARSRERGIDEIVFLSTCNRVELYFAAPDIPRAIDGLLSLLDDRIDIDRRRLEPCLYRKYSRDAAAHLFSVASSIDSMVIGENEIVGQVKDAYRCAVSAKRTGPLLNRLFHQAFKTAKRVRTETEIAHNPLSVAFIAAELAKKIFEDLSRRSALLIGAGDMGELILKYFTKSDIREITIANRSLHNAERIAEEINRRAHIIPLEDIPEAAARADIIIASSGSDAHLITEAMGREIARRRRNNPLFVIDIGVPRNVDPAVGALDGIYLYNVDDLRAIADENLKSRMKELEVARQFVEADADDFMVWYERLDTVPLISAIQERFDEIRRAEFERYRRRRLKHLSDADLAIVEDLTRQIMTKTLHNPIQAIKRARAEDGPRHRDRAAAKKLIQDLFDS